MTLFDSPASPSARRLRAGVFLCVGALSLIGLSGCAADAAPSASGSASAPATGGSSSSASASAAATATPTPTPTPAGTAVAMTCTDLLTLDDVYAFNPNYGTDPSYKPTSASAKTAASFQGLTCGLLNQSSDGTIEISLTQPNAQLMTQQQDKAVASSKIVPTYGTPPTAQGFFAVTNGIGEAQVFTDTYWLTISSSNFLEPGDAESLVSAALGHLK
ncbi:MULTISPECIES: hypothetical protein [unclassified Cryobacterium]|uniref:hypothetical protein n=1 Tax=unclassified Cryobacterium TaxID=2649013 RepID=UPI00141BD006|nr:MULTISPECIES: hypothetical protein [unclassified Cryobacterium]